MAPAATTSPSSSPSIPLPHSFLTASPTHLPTATQKALITTITTLPSSTSADPTQTALHDLSTLLTDSLARTGWTDRVRALALELLSNGKCTTFPKLLSEVTRRATIPRDRPVDGTPPGRAVNGDATGTNGTAPPNAGRTKESQQPQTNGVGGVGQQQQGQSITVREGWFGPDGLPDVRVPVATVETGVEYLKGRLKECVEVVPDEEIEDESDDE